MGLAPLTPHAPYPLLIRRMNTMSLLGQADVFPTFLTPIWLLCVGVAGGLALVLLFVALLFLLSRLPVIGTLAENDALRRPAGFVLAIILLATALVTLGPAAWQAGGEDATTWDNVKQIMLLLLVAVPGSLAVSFSLIMMCSRRAVDELPMAIREGVLYWITMITGAMTAVAIVGVLLAWVNGFGLFLIVEEPLTKLEAYPQTFVAGRQTIEFPIGQYDDRDEVIEVDFVGSELRSLEFMTDQELMLASEEIDEDIPMTHIIRIPVKPTEPIIWTPNADTVGAIPQGQVDQLFVRNMGDGPATLRMTIDSTPPNREVAVITTAAICVMVLYILYFLQRSAMPKVSAVALSTFKTEVAQPLYLLLLILGTFFMLVSIYIPYNTFGEDIKMLKDSGLTAILVAGIFMAVWAASKSVADEIEGRTALTVLSKPIGRREFILGKFLGISWAIGLLFILLSIGFLLAVSYKVVYDARESAAGDVIWQTCFQETMQIIPGLALAFMEALVFVAISIAISTRLPMMANFPICLAIYVLGHLTPLMMQSTIFNQSFEGVVFVGQLIATIIPVLDHFNIQAAVAGGTEVPLIYLGYSLVYCLLYGAISMLLALVLFEDRDLA